MAYKILVADDDLDNRTISAEILECSGYTVLQAVNGLEAIEVTLKERPDVILLDLAMPRLNGWQTVQRLKAMPEVAHIPVIAFTAYAQAGDEQKAREAGCNDYLTKPCAPKHILQKVNKWLPQEPA